MIKRHILILVLLCSYSLTLFGGNPDTAKTTNQKTMYTLEDIYIKLTTGSNRSMLLHSLGPTAPPGSTMHTLNQIFSNIPSTNNIRAGVNGGVLQLPSPNDVKNGLQFGASGTEFTGVIQLPIPGDVIDGVGYGANGTEFVGTYVPLPCSENPLLLLMNVSYREMVIVPGGMVVLINASDTGDVLTNTVSAFQMGKYEVTYELWYTVYIWATNNGYTFANAGKEGQDGVTGAAPTGAKYEPVTYINWRDMIIWCNAYSEMSGLTGIYCSDAGYTTLIKDSSDGAYGSSINTTAGSFDNPYVNWNTNGFRLPTEGEWQYTASYKDGVSWTPYNYASGATADYNNAGATGLVAWYNANSGSKTQDVGTKTANALGIHDMSGNVWEWCWDWYGSWPGAGQTDYRGTGSGSNRVVRGGSWDGAANDMQLGLRINGDPYDEDYSIGLRIVRTP